MIEKSFNKYCLYFLRLILSEIADSVTHINSYFFIFNYPLKNYENLIIRKYSLSKKNN